MPKNAYFLEKDVKNRLSVGGSASEPPRCYSCLLLQLCQVHLALNAVYYLEKYNKFCIFQIFSAFLHFKLCSFCWQRPQKYFLPQGAGYPSYATVWVQKNFGFFEISGVRTDKRGGAWASADTFRTRGSTFCDFVRTFLWNAPNNALI